GRGARLLDQGGEELPLALDAVQVCARGRTGAYVAQSGAAVHLLTTGLDVQARLRVLHGLVRAQLHPADRVDQVHEPTHTDLDVVVDTHTRGALEAFHKRCRTATDLLAILVGSAHRVRVGGVDLVVVVPGDRHRHIGVARNTDDGGIAAVGDVQQHDRVGPSSFGLAGGQLRDLVVVQTLAAVGAHDHVRGARV